MAKVVFVSGIHGAGKSTFCEELQHRLQIAHYSSSSLIKANSGYAELQKLATNIDEKQLILLDALSKLTDPAIILDGHFCLLDHRREVVEINDEIAYRISPSAIVHITCPADVIHQRLMKRDSATFSVELLDEMQLKETEKAAQIAADLNIPLINFRSGECMDAIIRNLHPVCADEPECI